MPIKTSTRLVWLLLGLSLPCLANAASYSKNNEKEDVVPLAKLNPNFGAGAPQGATVDTGIVLSNDGKVWLWGFKGSGQGGNGSNYEPDQPPRPVASLDHITKVAGGIYHLLALDTNGDLWGWGQSGYGETGCPNTYQNIPCNIMKTAGIDAKIAYMDAGEYWSIALATNGDIYTWGHNVYGQLGIGEGPNRKTPQHLNTNERMNNEKGVLVGAAYEHGYAITVNQSTGKYTVWGWGDNEAQALGKQMSTCLGPGPVDIQWTPKHITTLDAYASQITYIAGGNGWGTALLQNGDVIGWGALTSLGQGVTSNSQCTLTPIKILTNVERLYSRYVGSVALTRKSEIYTWGQTPGSIFPMIYGSSVTKRTPIGTPVLIGGGKEHIYYTNTDGEMYGVGYNLRGHANPNSTSSQHWPGGKIPIDVWLAD